MSSRVRSLGAALPWLATALAVALGALMFVPALLGMQRYVITGGSMAGSYERGSIVFDRVVPTASLRVGDVVTFRTPVGSDRHLVTHRIVAIGRDRTGVPSFSTKGDANAAPDPWRITLPASGQARVAFSVPYAGYVLAALSERWLRMLVIGLPALLIALLTLGSIWQRAGRDARRDALPTLAAGR